MMTCLKDHIVKVAGFAALAIFLMGTTQRAQGQLSKYQRLAFQQDQPNIFIDVFPLPAKDGNSLQLTATFHISNNFLTFRKLNSSQRNEEFFSTSNLNIEVFKSPKKSLKPYEQVEVEGLESVGRASWSDTAYAASYEQTKSNKRGLNGAMQVELQPGYYTYLLQLSQDQSTKTRNSQTRNIRLSPFKKQGKNDIILGKKVDNPATPSMLKLINKGNRVIYREDFYALIPIPDYNKDTSYTLKIDRIRLSEDDTTKIEQVLEQNISAPDIHQNLFPSLVKTRDSLSLALNKVSNGYTYALVKIPNSRLPNARYQLTVSTKAADQPIVQDLFQSYWSDIPTSLLSLDVAIDMLRFITNEQTIERIDEGSDRERERKFREFWSKKDPTPKTVYNELQAEYYGRIDRAYEKFGSPKTPGFNTDRGRIYINYGPPNDIKRTFPTDGATTEVWKYDDRRFVFKATSGFGDFKLVSQ